MAETSSFWNGVTTGDATMAPYSAAEVATALNNILDSFVIPYTHDADTYFPGDELRATESSTIGKLDVLPGAAFVKGILYSSDELIELSIASNAAGNPRIDRIVLQRSTVNQTVRAVVKQGTAAASPAIPVLDTANEIPLAWVWVANGYNAAANIIPEEEIHDERVFKETGPSHELSARKNLLLNAEFLALTGVGVVSVPKWKLVGPPTVGALTGTYRGRLLSLTSAVNNEGIETTVSCNMASVDTPLFTLEGYAKVTQGVVSINVYSVNLPTGASTLLATKYFRPGNAANTTRFMIRQYISTVRTGIRIVVNTESPAANDTIQMGEFNLSHGYMPTIPYNHEIIWFDEAYTDAAWSATAKSTGATTINMAAFGTGLILPNIRGVILRVRGRDSGSAGVTLPTQAGIYLHHANQALPSNYPIGAISLAGKTNDTWEEQVMWVPVDHEDANIPIQVYVYATGAGTLDATIEVLGIIT